MRTYDAVIVGGGIAGAFLARHLKIAKPTLTAQPGYRLTGAENGFLIDQKTTSIGTSDVSGEAPQMSEPNQGANVGRHR